jgi:hypothetical protein
MEDILDLYTRPLDPARPLVCFDETSKQLVGEVRTPLPMAPGHPACYDTAYERHGTANLFLFTAPLLGWREIRVTDHRTRVDFAHIIRDLVDVHFPDAARITLVLDNLKPTSPPRSTRPSNRPRPNGFGRNSTSTPPPSTAVGSTSPRSSSAC